MLNFLVKQPERNDQIMAWLKHDVLVEKRKVLVLAERTEWCLAMAENVTKELGIRGRAILGGLKTKKALAYRDQVQVDMMNDLVDVIFATSVFKAGVDIPRLDTLYDALPGNNAPQLDQKTGRIRRPFEGKNPPIYRYFVDGGFGMLIGCAKGTQRALADLGFSITLVGEDRTPASVMAGPIFTSSGGEPREPKGALRGIANRQPDAVGALFKDLAEESRQTKRYHKRLGGGEQKATTKTDQPKTPKKTDPRQTEFILDDDEK